MTTARSVPEEHDFCGRLERAVAENDPRSAEQWARAVFEEAPVPVRVFLLLGWRGVLGLRLGPRGDPRRVLGWRIGDACHDEMCLRAESWLIEAVNVVRLEAGRVTWTTSVRYRNRSAAVVWALVLPIHKVTVSRLLGRAARRGLA